MARTGQKTQPSRADDSFGLVFNIQKFSLHDGAGIRTLVFLKGCPLACRWCANPEGQSCGPELAYIAARCLGEAECDCCIPCCEEHALRVATDGKMAVDRGRCSGCGACVDACPSQALQLFGTRMSVEEVIGIVEEDSRFYARSGGGLTLSGGEPLSQAGFAANLLRRARERGIHTALETTGLGSWRNLEALCAHVDQVFYDVKCSDPVKHRAHTSMDNKPILKNLARLRRTFPELPISVRTPIVPGFNDTPEEIRAIRQLLDGLGAAIGLGGAIEHELLPYHGFGEPKYSQLGRSYPLQGFTPPSDEQLEALLAVAAGGAEKNRSTDDSAGRRT